MLKILNQYEKLGKRNMELSDSTSSPLIELNRMREHLEDCLQEVTTANKKNDTHKKLEIQKKNYENSELLKEINELRRRVRELEVEVK